MGTVDKRLERLERMAKEHDWASRSDVTAEFDEALEAVFGTAPEGPRIWSSEYFDRCLEAIYGNDRQET